MHTSLHGRKRSQKESKIKGVRRIDSQVGSHDNEEVAPLGHLGFEEFSVIDGLLRRVNRARANDDEKSIVISGQNSSTVVASRGDSLLGGRRRDYLVAKQSRLDEGVILDWNESETKSVRKGGGDSDRRTPMTRRS